MSAGGSAWPVESFGGDGRAVFLSYASQDAEAARQLSAALRVAGVEVWFDQSDLVGGDAWDAKIRRQIKACALFVPIISANTQARLEGYFRIEWKLAAQRTHAMAEAKPFLLPVVVDDTADAAAHVPEEFRAVQWTRFAAGETPNAFCERVRGLLNAPGTTAPFTTAPFQGKSHVVTRTLQREGTISFSPVKLGLAVLGALGLGFGLFTLRDPAPSAKAPEASVGKSSSASAGAGPEAVRPPEAAAAKSIAVLAFANLSDDRATEYFSDGISEELLNLLAKVPGLHVAARTSAFFFKGKQAPVAEIAQKLAVAYVVEGSVRKAGNRVRITAQLVKAADGFPVWSDTFDRELKDIFALQDEIAGLIAHSLKLEIGVTGVARGAMNEQAYQLHLQGRQAWSLRTPAGLERAEQCFDQALAIEPKFARAIMGRADVWSIRGMEQPEFMEFGRRPSPAQARIVAEIERALALEPDLAEAHASLGHVYWLGWRVADAERALRRALTLDPNYATAHLWLGRVLQMDGRLDEALIEMKSAVDLDPLASRILDNYSYSLLLAGRLEESLVAADRAAALQPDNLQAIVRQAVALADLGRPEEAIPKALQLLSSNPAHIIEAGYVLAKCGMHEAAAIPLARMEEIQVRGVLKAYVLAALGRREECLQALEPAVLQASIVDGLFYFPVFDFVRDDLRFAQTIATVGLTEAHARAQAERAGWLRAKTVKR